MNLSIAAIHWVLHTVVSNQIHISIAVNFTSHHYTACALLMVQQHRFYNVLQVGKLNVTLKGQQLE